MCNHTNAYEVTLTEVVCSSCNQKNFGVIGYGCSCSDTLDWYCLHYEGDTREVKNTIDIHTELRIQGVSFSEVETLFGDFDFYDLHDSTSQKKIGLIRLFVRKLYERKQEGGFDSATIVKALSEIEDDFTFLQWTWTMRKGLWH